MAIISRFYTGRPVSSRRWTQQF